MELFRTVVKCTASPEKLGYGSPVLMLGSCFAESMGSRLQRLKFDTVLNPFGIVYHPAPAACGLQRIIAGTPYTIDDLQLHRELWCSFDHHGRFSHPDAALCLERINTELQQAHDQLARAEWLFVTFGSAWAYRLENGGRIVSNCHKLSASAFRRILFGVDEIYAIWAEAIDRLRQFNPAARTVFTVSPIRHLRDGAHENQLGKATLLLAVDRLNRQLENTGYFPAYEIVLDELRDYRFYSDDMAHPNTAATDYIWKRFCESYMAEDTLRTAALIEDIVKAAAHRPIHRTSECRKFAVCYLNKIAELNRQFDFTEEIARFEKMV